MSNHVCLLINFHTPYIIPTANNFTLNFGIFLLATPIILTWRLGGIHQKNITLRLRNNLVPRSLVDETEGEIWPNPICTT